MEKTTRLEELERKITELISENEKLKEERFQLTFAIENLHKKNYMNVLAPVSEYWKEKLEEELERVRKKDDYLLANPRKYQGD